MTRSLQLRGRNGRGLDGYTVAVDGRQSLGALCLKPWGSVSIWKYIETLVRSQRVCWRILCGFWTNEHCSDVCSWKWLR